MKSTCTLLSDGFCCLAIVLLGLAVMATPNALANGGGTGCSDDSQCGAGETCVNGTCTARLTSLTCQPSTTDDCPNFTSSTDCLVYRTCSDGTKNCSCNGAVDPVTLVFSCSCP